MMQVFQIKGLSGLVMFVLALTGVFLLSIMLPSSFMMVLWNAVVFEGFSGPEITLGQGLLLWVAVLILIKLFLNPQISFHFKKMEGSEDMDQHLNDFKKKHQEKP